MSINNPSPTPNIPFNVCLVRDAIIRGDIDFIKVLVTAENFPVYLTRFSSSELNNIRTIQLLLNCDLPFEEIKKALYYPLHEAAQNNDTELIAFLLEKGWNPNELVKLGGSKFPVGYTPLATAADARSYKSITALVKGGGYLNYGPEAKRPLTIAVGMCRKFLTSRLLELGAVPTVETFYASLLHQPVWTKRLLAKTGAIHLKEAWWLKFFMHRFILTRWSNMSWHLRRYYMSKNLDLSEYTTDMDSEGPDKKWIPPDYKEKLLAQRRERSLLLSSIRIHGPLGAKLVTSVERYLVDIFKCHVPKHIIKACFRYVVQANTNVLALLHFRQIGIPKDIRLLIVLLTFK